MIPSLVRNPGEQGNLSEDELLEVVDVDDGEEAEEWLSPALSRSRGSGDKTGDAVESGVDVTSGFSEKKLLRAVSLKYEYFQEYLRLLPTFRPEFLYVLTALQLF